MKEKSRDLKTEIAIFRKRTVIIERDNLISSYLILINAESTESLQCLNHYTVSGIASAQ